MSACCLRKKRGGNQENSMRPGKPEAVHRSASAVVAPARNKRKSSLFRFDCC